MRGMQESPGPSHDGPRDRFAADRYGLLAGDADGTVTYFTGTPVAPTTAAKIRGVQADYLLAV